MMSGKQEHVPLARAPRSCHCGRVFAGRRGVCERLLTSVTFFFLARTSQYFALRVCEQQSCSIVETTVISFERERERTNCPHLLQSLRLQVFFFEKMLWLQGFFLKRCYGSKLLVYSCSKAKRCLGAKETCTYAQVVKTRRGTGWARLLGQQAGRRLPQASSSMLYFLDSFSSLSLPKLFLSTIGVEHKCRGTATATTTRASRDTSLNL